MQNLANLRWSPWKSSYSLVQWGSKNAISINGKDTWCACDELLQTLDWESGHHNHGIILWGVVTASPHCPFTCFLFTRQVLQIQS